jgi:N-acetylglucosaminyl-diphospho-decaprenol L-rhamnosyltransferase
MAMIQADSGAREPMSSADVNHDPSGRALLGTLSIVIVLYESAEVIAGCLATLPPEAEVILVDNASSDGGAERGARARPDAVVISSERNLGFGGGCNLGWHAASRPYLAFVNPDVRLNPKTLVIMLGRLREAGGGMVGPAMLDESGVSRSCKRRPSAILDALGLLPSAARWAPPGADGRMSGTAGVHRHGGQVATVEGACFAIRRDDLERIGGFDEDFFLYYEEESLALRLERSGAGAIYEPAATAEHLGGTSTREIGALATYHFHRSRAIFYRKRDGELRGRLTTLALMIAVLIALPVSVLNRVLGRHGERSAQIQLQMLRGLVDGARTPLSRGVDY